MSSANEKSKPAPREQRVPVPHEALSQKDQSIWESENGEDSWYVDSQIPASEFLSDMPDAAAETEDAELLADREDDLDDDEDEGHDETLEARDEQTIPGREKQRGRRRSKTIARKQMLRERRRMLAEGALPEIVDYERPGLRSQCRGEKRPCLYVSCRYHLFLDVNPMTGSIKVNFPDRDVWTLEETCALDVAERGGITLEEVGDIMNLTRERIRQVEVSGLDKLRVGDADLHTFLDGRELETGPIKPNQG